MEDEPLLPLEELDTEELEQLAKTATELSEKETAPYFKKVWSGFAMEIEEVIRKKSAKPKK